MVRGLDEPGDPLELRMEDLLWARAGYTEANGWLVIPLDVFFGDSTLASLDADRDLPVFFAEPANYSRTGRFRPPVGMTLKALPNGGGAQGGCGDYELVVQREPEADGAILIAERLHLTATRLVGPGLDELRRFFGEVAALRRQAIVVRDDVAGILSSEH